MFQNSTIGRRRILIGAVVSVPLAAVGWRRTAQAQDLPPVQLDNPTARALLYVHDAADVDASNPLAARFEAGQNCANCIQIQGDDGAEWRPCPLFPGQTVNAAGWCSAWAPKG